MSMKPKFESADAILAIVRGEMPLSVLPELGIEIICCDGTFELRSGPPEVALKPSASDIACGILAHQHNRDTLRAWAFFILGESDIDLENVESHPQGEALIEALWEASSKGEVGLDALKIANGLC